MGIYYKGPKADLVVFCDIIFHEILPDLDSLRKLPTLDNGCRHAPGYRNSIETPKVFRKGKKNRFMHIWDKV